MNQVATQGASQYDEEETRSPEEMRAESNTHQNQSQEADHNFYKQVYDNISNTIGTVTKYAWTVPVSDRHHS